MTNLPLSGVRVVELAGIGPVQFATMFLAQLGADVVRLVRPPTEHGFAVTAEHDLLDRGKRLVDADLHDEHHRVAASDLIARSDVVVEGLRPGVVERLGLGPEHCLARTPRLVYARMTGWGQWGPRATDAGHDINFIAATGVLAALGSPGTPPPVPLSVIGDYAGGANYLVIGVLAALRDVERTGRGQVLDVAMVDGVCHLLTAIHALVNDDKWRIGAREQNILDGGAPFYATYATADGRHLAVGAIEPKFYANLIVGLGLAVDPGEQYREDRWATTKALIADRFRSDTQQAWVEHFAGIDACVTPVLTFAEAAADEHLARRRSLRTIDGALVAGTAPRFGAST